MQNPTTPQPDPYAPLDAKVRELARGRTLRDRIRTLRAWRAAVARGRQAGENIDPSAIANEYSLDIASETK